MKRKWEAHTNLRDGFSRIEFADGEELIVKNDGVTGYAFVEEYLEEMGLYYPSHLEAADLKLKMRLGRAYKTVKAMHNRYRAELALISLNCCFGALDSVLDHEGDSDFNTEFTLCPERYNCPFNGFNPKLKDKRVVCCNPIYECGLSPKQAEIADMMANTALSYEAIADKMGCSYSNIDNIRKRIFAELGVTTRPELTMRLKGKRLL